MSPELVGLASAAGALGCLSVFALRLVLRLHKERVRNELARGHLRLRRRIAQLAGRKQDRYATVTKAETMYGHDWLLTTRHPGQGLRENMGWAPTRRSARRRLAKAERNR